MKNEKVKGKDNKSQNERKEELEGYDEKGSGRKEDSGVREGG